MLGILATVEQLVALGVDVAPYLLKLAASFQKGAPPPSQATLATYRAEEAAMTTIIDAPLPEERP